MIPGRKIAIYSPSNTGNLFAFTQNKEGYRELPVGEQAYVVAIGVRNGTPVFGLKQIVIPVNGVVEVQIGPSDKEKIVREVGKIANS